MTIAIVGLGLIGGSAARDLARTGLASVRIGVESDPRNLRTALDLGLIDRGLPLTEAVTAADLIILAVPVDAILRLCPRFSTASPGGRRSSTWDRPSR
jgi:prephenate dehydrogenase